jgi:hypothetical protein
MNETPSSAILGDKILEDLFHRVLWQQSPKHAMEMMILQQQQQSALHSNSGRSSNNNNILSPRAYSMVFEKYRIFSPR